MSVESFKEGLSEYFSEVQRQLVPSGFKYKYHLASHLEGLKEEFQTYLQDPKLSQRVSNDIIELLKKITDEVANTANKLQWQAFELEIKPENILNLRTDEQKKILAYCKSKGFTELEEKIRYNILLSEFTRRITTTNISDEQITNTARKLLKYEKKHNSVGVMKAISQLTVPKKLTPWLSFILEVKPEAITEFPGMVFRSPDIIGDIINRLEPIDLLIEVLTAAPDLVQFLDDEKLMSCLMKKPEFINRLSLEKQSQLIRENPQFLTHLDPRLKSDDRFLKASLLDSRLDTFKEFYKKTKPHKDLINIIEKNPENEENNAHRLEVALSSDPKCIYLLMAFEKDLNLLSKLSQSFSQPIKSTIISSLGNQQLLILLEKNVIKLEQIPRDKFNDPKFISVLSHSPEFLTRALQLLRNQELVGLLEKNVIKLEQIPVKKFTDTQFILELSKKHDLLESVFNENKVSFKNLNEDLRKNPSVAKIACKIDLANIEHVHSELKDTPEFLKSIDLEEGLLIKILKCFGVNTFSAWFYYQIKSNSDSEIHRDGPSQ